ncbi:nuclear transport factor 2 family protein [Saccharomonospora piscinae]|uniref:nuclear transport factor 2 family protein n=1 Tax=Saccharomonospora piscinae TaxID=687388 RepID=UPI000464D923|nr:nuclear transport factor 2 family protein [Saccharomonospora piscinae]
MTLETDRAEIIELFGRYADIADTKNFDDLPPLVHADPFTMDFESVTGMPPLETPLDDYVQALSGSFAPFIATHHAITGHVISIDGDRATAHAHVRAEHWLPEENARGGSNRWLVVGFYDNEAIRTEQGWRFGKVKLTAIYQEGTHLLAGVAASGAPGRSN